MTDKAGHRANKNGQMLEDQIEAALASSGYKILTPAEQRYLENDAAGNCASVKDEPWYCRQARVYHNIYAGVAKSDFVAFHAEHWPKGLVIETKWQQSQGSVDEKYPFTALSLAEVDMPGILVLDGGGYRRGAVEWLRKHSQKNSYKFFTLVEFLRWSRTNL